MSAQDPQSNSLVEATKILAELNAAQGLTRLFSASAPPPPPSTPPSGEGNGVWPQIKLELKEQRQYDEKDFQREPWI